MTSAVSTRPRPAPGRKLTETVIMLAIRLLKTFIGAGGPSMTVPTMMVSAIAIADTDRLLDTTASGAHRRHPPEEGV